MTGPNLYPFSGDLIVDSVGLPLLLPDAGRIGLVHCPGRSHTDSSGRVWARDLTGDLLAVKRWGATTLVSLVEDHEFATYGADKLPDLAPSLGLHWVHVPIPDMQVPRGPGLDRLLKEAPILLARLKAGERIVLHCAAGLGRSGMVAAALLTMAGLSAEDAIAAVRQARPGTIETAEQEEFVRSV